MKMSQAIMTTRPPLKLSAVLFPLFIALQTATPAFADTYSIKTDDYACTGDDRLVSINEARQNRAIICNQLGDWDVARLAGNASFSGAGNKCEIRAKDLRELGKSICTRKDDYGQIRGILLLAGFRSQSELNALTPEQWRQALHDELRNRTGIKSEDLTSLDNQSLADVGGLYLYLKSTPKFDPLVLAKNGLEDIRQSVRTDVQTQTGLSMETLKTYTDGQLLELLFKG